MRDRPAGDARGDRRLAALRPGRLAAGRAGVGPVAATADLDPTENGTRLRLRWAYQGGAPADPGAIEQMRNDKEAAYARLATVIAGALPVVQQKEARP